MTRIRIAWTRRTGGFPWASAAVAAGALLVGSHGAGCSFDDSALSARGPCVRDSDCPGGQCLGSSCYYGAGANDTGVDAPVPDVTPDTPGPTDVRVCVPFEATCTGNVARRCNASGTAVEQQNCSMAGACESDRGCQCVAGTCEPRICVPGTRTCGAGDEVLLCDALGTGQQVVETCEDGRSCIGGSCVDAGCEPGEVFCAGTAVAVCNESGRPIVQTECADDGQTCAVREGLARCVAPVCIAGTTRCAAGGIVETCAADGSGFVATQTCADPEVCSEGRCVRMDCEEGALRCADAATVVRCTEGMETVDAECAVGEVCTDEGGARCVQGVCAPGTVRCGDGGIPETCNGAGTGFVPQAPCGEGTVCETGACRALVCAPGTRACRDDATLAVCNATGTGETDEACGELRRCEAGACIGAVCAPGERFCDGATVRVCNGEGTGSSVGEVCESGCDAGACSAGFCGDGVVQASLGETCDDANDNACDGCEDCTALFAGRVPATSVVSPTANLALGTADVTIEGWFRRDGATGPLFGVGTTTSNATFYLGVDETTVYAQLNLGSGAANRVRVQAPGTGIGAAWTHIAATRFGGRHVILYVDGVAVASGATTGNADALNTNRGIWIGTDTTFPATRMLVDGVRISRAARYLDRYLPPRDHDAEAPDTLALYRFNDGSGTTVSDASGNGRNLTMSPLTWIADGCYAVPARYLCGDGLPARWEECDDGNTVSGDGCSSDCRVEVACREGETAGPSGRCYSTVQAATWTAVRDTCAARGGRLATVRSIVEHLWILRTLAAGRDVWIGLNDRQTEGTYVWEGGANVAFRFWAPGEPNDGGAGRTEDCVVISNRADGAWNDVDCQLNRVGVCER